MTFLHLGIGCLVELGGVIGAGFKAQATVLFAYTGLLTYQYDAIIGSLVDGIHRTGRKAVRFGAVQARKRIKSDKDMGEFALLHTSNPAPVYLAGRYVMPIFAGHGASVAPGASRLVYIKSQLHIKPSLPQ
jgi:hypothetical protein